MGDKGGSVNVKRRSSWLALLALLTAAIAIAAPGCGGGDEGDTSGAASSTPSETTGGEPISVGLVTDIGGLNDRGFNSLANQGLENARASWASRATSSSPSPMPTTSRTC